MKQIYINKHARQFSSIMIFGAVGLFTGTLHAATPYDGYAPQGGYAQQSANASQQVQYPVSISQQTYGAQQGGNSGQGYNPSSSYYQPQASSQAQPVSSSTYGGQPYGSSPSAYGNAVASAPASGANASGVPSYQAYRQNQNMQSGAGSVSPMPVQQPSAQPVAMQQPSVQPVVIGGSASAPSMPVVPSMAAEPVIEGFADQVPLTVALQQILPQGYSYNLGDGVNPGQLVSWRGGRPWNVVLGDMLGTSGLGYNMNDRQIMIGAMGAAPMVITGSNMAPQQMPQPMMQQPMMQQQMAQQDMQQQAPAMAQQPAPMPPPMMMDPQMPQQTPAGVMQPEPLQIENPPVFVPQVWEARPGQTLRQLLQDWCARAGVELNWAAEYDYPVMASLNMTGTFEEAVRVLLSGFDGARPVPRARLHYNPAAGQSALIVEATGNHYGD